MLSVVVEGVKSSTSQGSSRHLPVDRLSCHSYKDSVFTQRGKSGVRYIFVTLELSGQEKTFRQRRPLSTPPDSQNTASTELSTAALLVMNGHI
jgi:hypothetical protein